MQKNVVHLPRTGSMRNSDHRVASLATMFACAGIVAGCAVAVSGCSGVFNPSFVNLFTTPAPDDTGRVPQVTIPNAPGHVPVVFVNNTRFDQNLLNFFDSIGVDTSDPDLRPRLRVRAEIEYIDGNSNVIEFIDGSSIVQASATVGAEQQAPLIPGDLVENDLNNVVAICDVQRVAPGLSVDENTVEVEVFVPAFLKVIRIVETEDIVRRELVTTMQPSFLTLQPDQVNADGDITALGNFDVRDAPVPATNIQCGSVVGFVVTGTVQLPFVVDETGQNVPGFLDTDDLAQRASPGRFEFRTTIR